MTVYNLGSINIDHFYRVPHIPAPGETLSASSHMTGLGGKGANQSVAAAQAGARAVHIGAVGPDGGPWVDRLRAFGVETRVAMVEVPTAHANICVDDQGENMIVIFPGANAKQSLSHLENTLSDARPGDTLLLQNETDLQVEAAELACAKGMRVIYSAAPFDVEAVQRMLPVTDLLVMNEVEAAQLSDALGDIPLPDRLITRGAEGVSWIGAEQVDQPAFKVTPVDTTGAGDCFIGSFAAARDQGMALPDALRFGQGASALQVTRPGTADAIPKRRETEAFLAQQEEK